MITITVYKNEDQQYEGFLSEGHAGYGTEGSDIICAAAVSYTHLLLESIIASLAKLRKQLCPSATIMQKHLNSALVH